MLKKRVISNYIVTVLKALVKCALADVICYSKMTSIVALDSVTSFLHLKDVPCDTVQVLAGFLQCNGGKLEEAEDFKCVFVDYCVLESK